MFLSIIITLIIGSAIGVITSISVYGFISLVKFLTNIFRHPDRSFDTFFALFTDTGEFLLFIILIPFSIGLIVGIFLENMHLVIDGTAPLMLYWQPILKKNHSILNQDL